MRLDAVCVCGHSGWFHDSMSPWRCRVGEGSLLMDLCGCRSFTEAARDICEAET